MEIEKGSRFYRFLYFLGKWGHDRHHPSSNEASMPSTVCSLFWYVIWGSLIVFGKMFIFLSIGIIIFWITAGFLLYTFRPLISFQLWNDAGAIPAMLIWMVLGYIAILVFRDTEYYRELVAEQEQRSKNVTQKSTGIVTGLFRMLLSYAKSFKDKICPVVEYIEND